MPYGLTSQQDINAKKFNKHFSALRGCQALLLAPQICHSNLTWCSLLLCETWHKTALLPRRGFSFAGALWRLLTPSWQPFPPMLLYLPGWRTPMGICWTAWLWQRWICETSSTILLAQTHCLSRKTWTKEGKDWLLMGWKLIHAQKSHTGSEKQLPNHGQGRGIGMPPARVYTYNWLGTALWHPSGENWRAEERQGNFSLFQLGSWSCSLLAALSYTFFLRFAMGRVGFLSLCFLHDHCAG